MSTIIHCYVAQARQTALSPREVTTSTQEPTENSIKQEPLPSPPGELFENRLEENLYKCLIVYFRQISDKQNFQLFQFLCLAPLSRRGEEMRTMSIFLQQLLLKMSKRCVSQFSETQNNNLLDICEEGFAEICD